MTRPPSSNTPCRILLVRHAVAEGNGRFHGHTDAPLAPEARQQIRVLVRKVSSYPLRVVYSSDLQRARATATAVARRFDAELVVRPGLREIHFGCWEGLSWTQIARRFPRLSRAWLTRFPHQSIPGAERFDAFKKRVARELDEIVTANPRSCVAIVTHAGVARLIVARALGVPDRHMFRIAMAPSALSVIDVFPDGATVHLVNG
jgi:broad specificity phosphatase PhoE